MQEALYGLTYTLRLNYRDALLYCPRNQHLKKIVIKKKRFVNTRGAEGPNNQKLKNLIILMLFFFVK